MSPFKAIETAYFKTFDFAGRASWAEYWYFFAFSIGLMGLALVADIIDFLTFAAANGLYDPSMATIWAISVAIGELPWPKDLTIASFWTPYVLVLNIVPMQAATARRLHDTGRTSKFVALAWAPVILLLPTLRIGFVVVMASAMASDGAGIEAVLESVYLVASLYAMACLMARGFLIILLWARSDPEQNQWGQPPLSPTAAQLPSDKPHNPLDAYAALARYESEDLATRQARNREEIKSLYQSRVLGRGEAEPG